MKTYTTNERMKYESEQVWFPLSENIGGWEDRFHALMLNDQIRMCAYEQAIKETIKPGMVVVDIGTGTGILALWALEAGARKVYGVEMNPWIAPQAEARIAHACYAEKFDLLNGCSYNIELPEQVDVVLSEILGNLGDNEDMAPILADARKRFLRNDGLMLPARVETTIVPVSSEKAWKRVKNRTVRSISPEYSIEKLLEEREGNNPFNMYYDCVLPVSTYLSKPLTVAEFRFDGKDKVEYKHKAVFKVGRSGTLTGFKGSFNAQLSPSVRLDISPDGVEKRETSDCWKHAYLPIEMPCDVEESDLIHLTYSRSYPSESDLLFRQIYTWKGEIRRSGKIIRTFAQKTG